MTKTKATKTEQAALNFADAILRLWGSHLEISAMVMDGHRARLKDQRSPQDPYASSFNLEIAMQEALQGEDTSEIKEAKLEMVASLLYVWYRVQPTLRKQIFKAVRELAIIRKVPLDGAHHQALDVIEGARHVEQALSEKRAAGLRRMADKEAAREQALRNQTSERLERQALQGI